MRRARNTDAAQCARVLEQPLFEWKVVVLHISLAQDKPIVNVEVEQGAGRRIETQETFQTRDIPGGRWVDRDESQFRGHRAKRIGVPGIDEKVEVCAPQEGVVEVLVALPMGICDALIGKTFEEGGCELQLIQAVLRPAVSVSPPDRAA